MLVCPAAVCSAIHLLGVGDKENSMHTANGDEVRFQENALSPSIAIILLKRPRIGVRDESLVTSDKLNIYLANEET